MPFDGLDRDLFVGAPVRRETRHLVVHVTATSPAAANEQNIADRIDRYHRETLGWRWGCGYNELIAPDGSLIEGRGVDAVGAHVSGWNSVSYGIGLIGGIDVEGDEDLSTITDAQWATLERRLRELTVRYPGATICGHRSLYDDRNQNGVIDPEEWRKWCPGFNAMAWAAEKGLPPAPIKEGDERSRPIGPDARLAYLQRLLDRAGFDPGPDDGIMGPRTQAATEAFQRANGISPSGALNRVTVDRLRSLIEAPAAPDNTPVAFRQMPIEGLDKPIGQSSTVHAAATMGFLSQVGVWFSDLPTWLVVIVSLALAIGALWIIRERMRYARAARAQARGEVMPEPEPDLLDVLNAQINVFRRDTAETAL